jgi:hypothetical protein
VSADEGNQSPQQLRKIIKIIKTAFNKLIEQGIVKAKRDSFVATNGGPYLVEAHVERLQSD